MLEDILDFLDRNSYDIGNQSLRSNTDFNDFAKDSTQTIIEEGSKTGLRLTQYETDSEYTTKNGSFRSLEARSASAHGINLARLVGLPENETFDEGVRLVELKRALEDHYRKFEKSDSVMPIYVPERTVEFLDLRLSPELNRSESSYPATLIYGDGNAIPVFVNNLDKLSEILENEDYKSFHKGKESWREHTDYEKMLNIFSDDQENIHYFAIPHIYSENNGVYFPPVEDMTLVNVVDNIFADAYDSSYLSRRGNSSAEITK